MEIEYAVKAKNPKRLTDWDFEVDDSVKVPKTPKPLGLTVNYCKIYRVILFSGVARFFYSQGFTQSEALTNSSGSQGFHSK